jgi:outer membrane protein OmpA-like peptidoglycan-associated protein
MFVVVAGFALGGCALFNTGDSRKQNTFEVFFDTGQSTITTAAARILQDVADSATQGDISSITLAVHTDTGGRDAASQSLSDRRAEAVKAELVKDGVPVAEITSVGVDENNQLVPTSDGVHEPQNRRTEIILR